MPAVRHLLLTLVALAALGALAAPASAETISVTDRTFSCDQTYPASRGLVVEIRITGTREFRSDAVHLDAGCSGEITLKVVIERGWDCIKVHTGAHDLVVRGWCEIRGRVGDVHQDFVQAMGGTNITFLNFKTRTVGQEGWNGGGGPGSIHSSFFVNAGAGGEGVPSNIVCEGCELEGGGSPVWINLSTGSGVRNSTVVRGTTGRCVTLEDRSQDALDHGNSCVGARLTPVGPDTPVGGGGTGGGGSGGGGGTGGGGQTTPATPGVTRAAGMLLGTPITLRYSRAWLNRHGWRFRFSIRVEHAHSVTARLQRNGKRLVTRVWRVRGAKRATVQLVAPRSARKPGVLVIWVKASAPGDRHVGRLVTIRVRK